VITASGFQSANAIAVAANGDVIVGGSVNESDVPPHHGNFAVVALDGATGQERWRYVAGGATASGYVSRLAVDSAGDVIAAGSLRPDRDPVGGSTVVGLSGATGALRWERTADDFLDVNDLAVDAHGDAYVAGTATRNGGDGGNQLGVAKIAGATGTTEWMARQSDTDRWQTATRVVVDGDTVFASGMTNDGTGEAWTDEGWVFRVLRLDPATGNVHWSYRAGGGGAPGFASHLGIASNGAILTAGLRGTRATCADGFVTALDRTTGEPRWSKRFDGSLATSQCQPECEEARDCPAVDDDALDGLGVDARGRILVAGHLVGGTNADVAITTFIRLLSR
jgi:outer membrane protein assembly factor BamB